MKLEDAYLKSIRKYFNENFTPEELQGASPKKLKYNKRYFDNVGEQYGIKPYGEADDN